MWLPPPLLAKHPRLSAIAGSFSLKAGLVGAAVGAYPVANLIDPKDTWLEIPLEGAISFGFGAVAGAVAGAMFPRMGCPGLSRVEVIKRTALSAALSAPFFSATSTAAQVLWGDEQDDAHLSPAERRQAREYRKLKQYVNRLRGRPANEVLPPSVQREISRGEAPSVPERARNPR